MEEFARADGIVRDVYAGKKSWSALFKKHSFFTKDHKYYLSVVAASRSKTADVTFSGLVQSKVRLLVLGIDEGQTGIELARPYTKGIERIHRCKNEDEVTEVTKGSLDHLIAASDVPEDGTSEDHIIYTTTFYIGLRLPLGPSPCVALFHHLLTRRQSAQHLIYRTPPTNSGVRSSSQVCIQRRLCLLKWYILASTYRRRKTTKRQY